MHHLSLGRGLPVAGLLLAVALVMLGDQAPARAQAGPDPIVVTAKLVEIPTKFPPDDLYDYAFVMKYVVVGGPMDKQTILVAHYKPRQPRSKIKEKHTGGKLRTFNQGDIHKLKLTADLKKVWKGALIDEYAATDHKSVRYWCLEADPA
ncbi:MAG: hypothetical protein QOI66_3891 [Myxococcales bacterium]|jgi:hypothetical protein|nr:hypothetical protein [Myxococcales bacterium]